MTRRSLKGGLTLAAALFLSVAAQSTPGQAQIQPPSQSQPVADTPYVVGFGDRIAVKVYLNRQGPFDFLLDTAATRTVIYEHARARLGLAEDRAAPVTVFGITGSLEAPSLKLDELRLADARAAGLVLAVVPDTPSRIDEPDGVLGLDVLRRYFIVLDRGDGRLRLYAHAADAPQDYLAWPHATLTARRPRRFPAELWYVDAAFNDRETIALFDLGAGVTILNWKVGLRLGIREEDFPYMNMAPEVQDVLGKGAPVVQAMDLKVDMAGHTWMGQNALIADAPVFGLLDLRDIPAALIGPGVLKGETLAVDFNGGKLYIAPSQKRRQGDAVAGP